LAPRGLFRRIGYRSSSRSDSAARRRILGSLDRSSYGRVPYLKFFNHKLSREATIPISERLVAQIRAQLDPESA
jgi:hypothetical protein